LSDLIEGLCENGPFGPARAALTKNGITTLFAPPGGARGNSLNHLLYGAWMENAGFFVGTARAMAGVSGGFAKIVGGRRLQIFGRFATAGGTLSDSAPSEAATWKGLMVGSHATGEFRNSTLQGDAALTFTPGNGGTLKARFDKIRNIYPGRGAASSTVVSFENIPVKSDGTYVQIKAPRGSNLNRISGAFYGTGHAEAAGTFEQANIVGAFGAKKQ